MATLHFLNVRDGDCSVIQHNSGRVTVIDVCNARPPDIILEHVTAVVARMEQGITGNFQQKNYPVNPVTYLRDQQITGIFRYVQTHPDMDHMDGLKTLFAEFGPLNFWDTDNTKEIPGSSWHGSAYNQEDWAFYKQLRDTKPRESPKRLALLSGAKGQFFNVSDDGSGGGDGLSVLAPTQGLVNAANAAAQEYNRCSYVILYRTGNNRIVFAGDSYDETWEYILRHYRADVTNVDLLIAPHHGRKSGRSYAFLNVLRPALTFFGNARCEHLAYGAWSSRGLSIVTNNQANCMVVDSASSPMVLYVTHENFARRVNPLTFYSQTFRAWYVGPITPNLIP